ncbi:16S rRNA (cytidine(1402)-2'-O)-methyltransferase [Mesoplasma photuris]|uniref:16S rRNA (cytidine(1402)-2'-O)-methyltransferase n=1 Tax=Mesoplasma photuris TaxID=217731 RepID=UPI0004E1A036|nr:16S rRNA (cytidine(1402)-2'-O)-methyltransferase [Mesoplasma photuris]
MRVQQTFKNNKPTIYLVGTPIGNLDDMPPRALKVLEEVDFIFCEDTRTTSILLSKFEIKNNLISLHMHNEFQRVVEVNKLLESGKNIAIVSDAGAPIISDPGATFLNELKKQDLEFNISSVNVGPAYIHAIVASGFISKQNLFYGFIESKNEVSKKNELLNIVKKYNDENIIAFYESVHRIKSTIKILNELLNHDQQVVVAREITKLNEEYISGNISEVNEFIQSDQFIEKGEFVIVLDKYQVQSLELSSEQIANKVKALVDDGYKTKQACEFVANESTFSKNEIYKIYLDFFK